MNKEYPIEEELEEAYKTINQLTNNWNELEEWLKEYIKKNDKWFYNELSTNDKQYYGDSYYTTNYMLKNFLDKMNEIKECNNALHKGKIVNKIQNDLINILQNGSDNND